MRKLLLYVMMLLPMIVNGAAVEINGIYYDLNSNSKTAEVVNKPSGAYYSGKITIPQKVSFHGVSYNVKSIGQSAFSKCSRLTSITIPNSVTSIGRAAFSGCSGLTSITIPNSVITIGDWVFSNCSGLTSVTISNGVTSIGERAFSLCSRLTSVTIPNSVTNIGDYAFYECSSLTSINIPSSVTSIGKSAFSWCSRLASVTIPNSVTSIGDHAFSSCYRLTSVTIPNSVTNIRDYAFEFCSGLTSVTIPNSVTSIGDYAFSWCDGLTSIVVEDGNANYDSRDECNAIIRICDNVLIVGCKYTNIPQSVTGIGNNAFGGCSGLTSITIPNSVTSIGDLAFCSCDGLTSITIPNSVTNIGDEAFVECYGLQDVFCYAIDVPKTNDYAFYEIGNAVLHVPSGSIDAYASTAPWKNFKYIVPIEEDDLQEYLNSLNSFDDTQDVMSGSIYTRQFLNTEWQSFYVPFSLSYSDWSNDFEVARLDKFSQYDDGEAERQELEVVIMRSGSDVLNANTPYLIRAKKAGTYNFTVNPSKLVVEHINSVTYFAKGSKVVITGNYANQSGLKSAGRYRLIGGSLSIPTKDEEVLPPYRWYATIENSDKAKVRITFINDATGFESISVDNEEMIGERKVYDLSGRCINISKDSPISSLPKGVYIINNKKYIIK